MTESLAKKSFHAEFQKVRNAPLVIELDEDLHHIIVNPDGFSKTPEELRSENRERGYSRNHNSQVGMTPLPEPYDTWGDLIIALCGATGETRQRLSELIGCVPSTLHKYVKNGISPTEPIRQAILKIADDYYLADRERQYADNI